MREYIGLTIEASTECNAKCKFCARNFGFNDSIIQIEDLKRFLFRFNDIEAKQKLINFTGLLGDIFQYSYIHELLKILPKINYTDLEFFTNGAYNPKINQTIISIPKFRNSKTIFYISIDSTLKKDKYREVNTQLSIKNAIELKKHGIHVIVKSLKFAYNKNELIKLNKILLDNDIEHYIVPSSCYTIDDFDKPDFDLPKNINTNDKFINPFCPLKKILQIHINSQGYLYPCCNINSEYQNILHINEYTTFNDLLKRFKPYKYFIGDGCVGCDFRPKIGTISDHIRNINEFK